MSVQIFKPETRITVTPPALEKIRKEISKHEGAVGMRLGVAKSGCTGYMYHIEIVEQTTADDHVFQVSDDVCVVVDAKSLPFLQGTQIDFVKNGLSAVFKFNNPNVQDQCGCGESFNVKEQVQ